MKKYVRDILCRCPSGKVCYRSHSAARRRQRVLASNRRTEDHAYRCPSCGHFHLTSQAKGGGATLNAPREGENDTPLMQRPTAL